VSLTHAPLSGAAAAVVGLVTFGAVAMDAGWQFVRHGTVMAHEGAHALLGSLLFRRVSGITLNGDATGGTLMNSGGCLGSVFVSFAGYVGPSLFGLGAARLTRSYGMITVVFVGVLVYAVGRYTPVGAQIIGAYGITWLLLMSGVRRVLEVGARSSDGANLSQLTMIPRLIWFLLWLAATLAALAAGGEMLVMPT
jgi:hypothetical protein